MDFSVGFVFEAAAEGAAVDERAPFRIDRRSCAFDIVTYYCYILLV